MVFVADTIANPGAVMVHFKHARIAYTAVVGARRSKTQTGETVAPFTHPVCSLREEFPDLLLNDLPLLVVHPCYFQLCQFISAR